MQISPKAHKVNPACLGHLSACLGHIQLFQISRHPTSQPQGPLPELLKAGRGGGAGRRGGVDPASAAQAHLGGLAGGCLALGIRFAGSQSAAAADAITEQLLYFLRCKALVPDASAGADLGDRDYSQHLASCSHPANYRAKLLLLCATLSSCE